MMSRSQYNVPGFAKCPECLHTNGEHAASCPNDPYSLLDYGMASQRQDATTPRLQDAETPRRHDFKFCPTPTPFNSGLYRDAWGAGGGGQIGGTKAAQGTANDAIRDALEQALANPVEHPKSDPINPSHYREHPSGVECIQITEHMGFNLGNAIKYVWRADLKGRAIEDLEKSIWYIQREIDKRRKAALSQTP